MNEIDKILDKKRQEGTDEEILDYIDELSLDNEELAYKYAQLEKAYEKQQNGDAPSIVERYRQNNKNLREKNSKLQSQIKKLEKKKAIKYVHLSSEELGVRQRMLDDFNGMKRYNNVTFPSVDHPIFNRFYELVNRFPNRNLIIKGINEFINKKESLIKDEISIQQKNLEIWEKCDSLATRKPANWEDEVTDEEVFIYTVTTYEKIEQEIIKLQHDMDSNRDWLQIKEKIPIIKGIETVDIKNNAYYTVMEEFERVYDLCTHVGGVIDYKANVRVYGFNQPEMYSALTRELENQLGLCEEPNTHTFFYSNGEGRLVPYELDRRLLKYVNDNTTFVQFGKKNKYKSGDIINSKILFEDIPTYCHIVQYRNPNLIGFNNCFCDISKKEMEIIPLNPQAPILPLKNTKTELYLDAEIEYNPMQRIFEECFTEEDAHTLLAYIGCALYDKGYTQRQESLYIMGKGGTGKSSFTKAICSIFYSVGHQLVTKLSDKNEFGFSVFAESDVVIIDEIQAAKKEFVNKIKNISGGGALPVEKKHANTISVPAENVPRTFFIGNNFSYNFYEESDNSGWNRRILIVIPTKPIQSLGYQPSELVTDSCKQWLVQQATKEYIKRGLNNSSVPIEYDEDEKNKRIFKCTYPEEYFIGKHFEMARLENGVIDTSESIKYKDIQKFIAEQIDKDMLEATIKKTNANLFTNQVRKAFNLSTTYMLENDVVGDYIYRGIIPKSKEAIEYFSR